MRRKAFSVLPSEAQAMLTMRDGVCEFLTKKSMENNSSEQGGSVVWKKYLRCAIAKAAGFADSKSIFELSSPKESTDTTAIFFRCKSCKVYSKAQWKTKDLSFDGWQINVYMNCKCGEVNFDRSSDDEHERRLKKKKSRESSSEDDRHQRKQKMKTKTKILRAGSSSSSRQEKSRFKVENSRVEESSSDEEHERRMKKKKRSRVEESSSDNERERRMKKKRSRVEESSSDEERERRMKKKSRVEESSSDEERKWRMKKKKKSRVEKSSDEDLAFGKLFDDDEVISKHKEFYTLLHERVDKAAKRDLTLILSSVSTIAIHLIKKILTNHFFRSQRNVEH
jgi:hypothetical protein